jgi:hypothetical protein
MRFVREQFYLAATAQNLNRLVRFLSRKLTIGDRQLPEPGWSEETKEANKPGMAGTEAGLELRCFNRHACLRRL